MVSWLPPGGMTGRIYEFDPTEGGGFRMALTYKSSGHTAPGKTSQDMDVFRGRFLELVPDQRIVQLVKFESDDPAFAGKMTMTWSFTAVPDGTEVTITCEGVPEGIRPEDHDAGLKSSLENLATFTERSR